jgi:hypothetical protein
MGTPFHFEVSSGLAAEPEAVWEHATRPSGVNYELAPLVRMTFPRRIARLDLESVDLGRRLGRCWMLLFGVLPVDWDDLTLVHPAKVPPSGSPSGWNIRPRPLPTPP